MTNNVTISSTTNNIYTLSGGNQTYSTAHNTYYGVYDDIYWRCGQWYTDVYYIYRGILTFDLSSLDGETITKAIMKMTGYSRQTETKFYMHMREYTESTLTTNNTCYNAYGSTSFGYIYSDDYSTSSDGMTITLNSSGLSYINTKVGGTCRFMFISDRDYSSTSPSNSEYMILYTNEYSTSASRPHLYLEYGDTWIPKIIMMFAPLQDSLLDWIRKPIQLPLYKFNGVI